MFNLRIFHALCIELVDRSCMHFMCIINETVNIIKHDPLEVCRSLISISLQLLTPKANFYTIRYSSKSWTPLPHFRNERYSNIKYQKRGTSTSQGSLRLGSRLQNETWNASIRLCDMSIKGLWYSWYSGDCQGLLVSCFNHCL